MVHNKDMVVFYYEVDNLFEAIAVPASGVDINNNA